MVLLGGPRQKPQDGHSTLQSVASSAGLPVLRPIGGGGWSEGWSGAASGGLAPPSGREETCW